MLYLRCFLKLLCGNVRVEQEWCKRWFVLTTEELACYCDSKDELTNDIESTLSIVPDTVVSDQDVGHTNGYAFHVSVRSSSFFVVIYNNLISVSLSLWG